MANKSVSKAKWLQMKGKVKEQWGKLTDNDVEVINGRIDQLVGKIQEKYSLKREDVEKDVHGWWDEHFQKDKAKASTAVKGKVASGRPFNKESLFKKLQHL
jgi:uncharacterized protein YjbJ (UPF0337 family)